MNTLGRRLSKLEGVTQISVGLGDYVRASFGDPEALARIEQAGPGSALSRLILAAFGSGLRA
jgi:hypothetical protein